MGYKLDRRQLMGWAATFGAAGVAGLSYLQHAGAQATPDATPAGGAETRTISAVNGEITISGTPERVVVMEYELAENLAILGVTPAGVTERDSIPQWVQIPPYPEDVVDVGTRDEPDIEAILSLSPDLILAASPRQDEVLSQLEAAGPVVQLSTYSPFFAPEGLTPHESFQQILSHVALAVNRTAEAEQAIVDFDALLATGTAAIDAAGFAGRPFVYGTIADQSGVNIFNDRSRIAFTVSELGLANLGEEYEETPGLHYVEHSIEQLGTLPEDTLFFTAVSPAIAGELDELFASDVWQALPFVQAGNFYSLGEPNVWTAGSAITLSDLIRRVTQALTGETIQVTTPLG